MAYQADIQTSRDHIRVEVSGRRAPGRTVIDAYDVGQRIVEECRKAAIEKVLLVSQLTGHIPALEAYEMITGLEDIGWSRSTKLAFVDMNSESHEESLFTETVAVNRAYFMKVFDNEEDARDWLLNS